MQWLKVIGYGLISGITESLPVSAQAHQGLMAVIFGMDGPVPLLKFLLHAACLLALLMGCSRDWHNMKREIKVARVSYRRKEPVNTKSIMMHRLLRTAVIPLMLVQTASLLIGTSLQQLYCFVLFLIINGILLFVPQQIPGGNRDARTMSALGAAVIGVLGGLSGFPGISGIAAMLFAGAVLGMDKIGSLRIAYFLTVPSLVIYLIFDIVKLAGGMEALTGMLALQYALAAAAACGGCYLSILTMRSLASKTGFSGFAFYSWGVAMFTMILFLTT